MPEIIRSREPLTPRLLEILRLFPNSNYPMTMIYQPERVLLSRQISKLVPTDPGKTLDVGGGDGSRYRNYFNTLDFTSLDIDPTTNPDVLASAADMPFMDSEFDTLLSSQVLEHVLSPHDCMNEMYRVLKPGGYLVLTVPQQNEMHSEPIDYWRFTKFGVLQLANESNFEVISILQRGGYHACRAQLRIRKWVDSYNPYQNPRKMIFFGQLTKYYTKVALWIDARFTSDAGNKNALGWCLLLRK